MKQLTPAQTQEVSGALRKITTMMVGEETKLTTMMVGEETVTTTKVTGEEMATTMALGEEGNPPNPTGTDTTALGSF
ncbi:MAG: hypothetical protein RI907_198 [Pseudomonadota bacterium]|jgi:hypothetical protein